MVRKLTIELAIVSRPWAVEATVLKLDDSVQPPIAMLTFRSGYFCLSSAIWLKLPHTVCCERGSLGG